jgi:8-oxo-dGTP pyrophosphatase MutT (NUDIX family)
VFATPRDAATVILVRPAPPSVIDPSGAAASAARDGVEVFLLRRRKAASFMGGAFVFPGGAADPGERDPRVTAARELFEEAGVLLAPGAPPAAELAALRVRVLDGAPLAPLLDERGLAFDVDSLTYFAHWITPSVEQKRFSARFYVAALPAGQEPRFDDRETVDQVWVTPADALARAGELALPPPQIRTFLELSEAKSVDEVFALARARVANPCPIMPRGAAQAGGFALLLPWDPEYESAGQGDLHLVPAGHPLATGPTRFVMEGRAWKHVYAPGSTPAA